MINLPKTINAVEISKSGDPSVLKPTIRPFPTLKKGEIIIKVSFAGVNRPDCLQRAGHYAPPPEASDLPGLEVAGAVVAMSKGVKNVKLGDIVTALTAGGGYADYVAVQASHALPIPKGLSLLEAAALPENYFTVWVNVFKACKLKKGEVFLVHGGSSGIGTTAIQLAKAFGAFVITTVGNEEKAQACLKIGADVAINYKTEDFVARVKEITKNRGVDVLLDMVGGDYISKNYEIMADKGRLSQIAFLQGGKAEVDFRRLMMKRIVHTGSTLRPRTTAEKAVIARDLQKYVWPLLEKGSIKPLIDQVFPLNEANNAHFLMEKSTHIGKIMLKI